MNFLKTLQKVNFCSLASVTDCVMELLGTANYRNLLVVHPLMYGVTTG